MDRSIQILPVFLLLLIASVVSAQESPTCGIVDIDGPSQVEPHTPVVLKVRITGIHTTKPEFRWKVSAGTITTGQNTDEITVDVAGLGGVDVIATVELSGAPPGCRVTASKTTQVKATPIFCGHGFNDYGDVRFEDEKARLDNFSIQLMNEPRSTAIILMTAGQVTFKNEARERLKRIKTYLVNVRAIDPNRIVTLDCGFTLDLNVRLSIVPHGLTHPGCYNPLEVPLSAVKFTKPRPKSSTNKR